MRERTAHAVMRLLGGRKLDADEVGEEIADMLEGDQTEAVFGRRERVMISGVLQLAERPVRSIMTPRAEVDHIDLADDPDKVSLKLMHSSYSRLPLIREGRVDEPLGFVHKKELLKELLAGNPPNLEFMARKAINLLDSFTILNALEQMRKESTHIAFVVNEFGDFIGLLTMTDILESIAGQLPDASEVEGPDIVAEEGGFVVSGALNLSHVRERTGFQAKTTEDYQTVAGLVMSLLDRLPRKGDKLDWEGWNLTVVGVQERRVTRVALHKVD
jgi:CBS domain containing-hemolysin-like protein